MTRLQGAGSWPGVQTDRLHTGMLGKMNTGKHDRLHTDTHQHTQTDRQNLIKL